MRHSPCARQSGAGKAWLDVGTGPGLVARLAVEHGYDAVGLDRDSAMVSAARRVMAHCRFEVGDVFELGQRRADVVSAASLLVLLPEPERALLAMWRILRPGGVLLAIETTPAMTPAAARKVRVSSGRTALALWARARNGRALDAAIFERAPAAAYERHLLLDGLVAAHILRKGAADG
jgi:ubiquinone/menaquinone biosynthesis C-methylase UbiE